MVRDLELEHELAAGVAHVDVRCKPPQQHRAALRHPQQHHLRNSPSSLRPRLHNPTPHASQKHAIATAQRASCDTLNLTHPAVEEAVDLLLPLAGALAAVDVGAALLAAHLDAHDEREERDRSLGRRDERAERAAGPAVPADHHAQALRVAGEGAAAVGEALDGAVDVRPDLVLAAAHDAQAVVQHREQRVEQPLVEPAPLPAVLEPRPHVLGPRLGHVLDRRPNLLVQDRPRRLRRLLPGPQPPAAHLETRLRLFLLT
eukprot:2047968-Rhodomonas_salina.1